MAVPAGHFPQPVVPQSTPRSVPFFTPSAQLFAAHLPDRQTPEAQSSPSWHDLPAAHALPMRPSAHTPPQSTSVSDWFRTPSSQESWARQAFAEQTSPAAVSAQTSVDPAHSRWATHETPTGERHTPELHV
jgi:hypothetical protein